MPRFSLCFVPLLKDDVSDEDRLPGVIYVGHVPHGFYEDEMKAYFSQFGDVLAIKLSRSKKVRLHIQF